MPLRRKKGIRALGDDAIPERRDALSPRRPLAEPASRRGAEVYGGRGVWARGGRARSEPEAGEAPREASSAVSGPRSGRSRLLSAGRRPPTPPAAGTGHTHSCPHRLASSQLHPRPRPAGLCGAHEGVDAIAAAAASRRSHSSPRRRGQGRSMSAEPEEKAALEAEAGAMPETRAGAQAAGGSAVSAGGGPAALFGSGLLVKGAWAGSRSEPEAASGRCPDSPAGQGGRRLRASALGRASGSWKPLVFPASRLNSSRGLSSAAHC